MRTLLEISRASGSDTLSYTSYTDGWPFKSFLVRHTLGDSESEVCLCWQTIRECGLRCCHVEFWEKERERERKKKGRRAARISERLNGLLFSNWRRACGRTRYGQWRRSQFETRRHRVVYETSPLLAVSCVFSYDIPHSPKLADCYTVTRLGQSILGLWVEGEFQLFSNQLVWGYGQISIQIQCSKPVQVTADCQCSRSLL